MTVSSSRAPEMHLYALFHLKILLFSLSRLITKAAKDVPAYQTTGRCKNRNAFPHSPSSRVSNAPQKPIEVPPAPSGV